MPPQHEPLVFHPANKNLPTNLVYWIYYCTSTETAGLQLSSLLLCLRKKKNTSCREAPKINKYVKQKKPKNLTGVWLWKRPIPSKCWQWSTLSHCSPLEQHRVPPHPTTTTTITKTSVSEAHRRPRRRTPLFCKWTTTLLHTQNPLTRHYTHG